MLHECAFCSEPSLGGKELGEKPAGLSGTSFAWPTAATLSEATNDVMYARALAKINRARKRGASGMFRSNRSKTTHT